MKLSTNEPQKLFENAKKHKAYVILKIVYLKKLQNFFIMDLIMITILPRKR